jgi:hypothetical protein
MRVINFGADVAEPIALFESVASSSVELGRGSGEVGIYTHPTETVVRTASTPNHLPS